MTHSLSAEQFSVEHTHTHKEKKYDEKNLERVYQPYNSACYHRISVVEKKKVYEGKIVYNKFTNLTNVMSYLLKVKKLWTSIRPVWGSLITQLCYPSNICISLGLSAGPKSKGLEF